MHSFAFLFRFLKRSGLFLLLIFFTAFGHSQSDLSLKWKEASSNHKKRNYKEAIDNLNSIINDLKIFKDSIFYLRASCYFETGDFHRAITDANRCVSLNKNNHEGYFLIGLIKSKSENYSGAIRSFNRAIRLAPDIPKYYYDRGVAYLRGEDIDDALTDFNKVIELKPDYAHAYFSRGYCKDLLGKTEEAINDIKKSIELDSKYGSAYVELALIYVKRKDTIKSCEVLNNGLKNGCNIPMDLIKKYCKQ